MCSRSAKEVRNLQCKCVRWLRVLRRQKQQPAAAAASNSNDDPAATTTSHALPAPAPLLSENTIPENQYTSSNHRVGLVNFVVQIPVMNLGFGEEKHPDEPIAWARAFRASCYSQVGNLSPNIHRCVSAVALKWQSFH